MTTPSENDSGGTPATTPDPEATAEGDTDQLPQEDTLLDRGVDSILDEGYSPPEREPNPNRLETELDQELGESLDDKLAQEQPEEGPTEYGRTGRLAPEDPDAGGEQTSSTMVDDVGISGAGASAEEAAMHEVEDET